MEEEIKKRIWEKGGKEVKREKNISWNEHKALPYLQTSLLPMKQIQAKKETFSCHIKNETDREIRSGNEIGVKEESRRKKDEG